MNKTNFTYSKDWTKVVIAAYAYDNIGNIIKSLDAMGYAAGTGNADNEKIYTGYGSTNTHTLSGHISRQSYDIRGNISTKKDGKTTSQPTDTMQKIDLKAL